MLTPKQRDMLLLIQSKLDQEGISPTYSEMCEELGMKSKAGAHNLVVGLEERGFISRQRHRARAIELRQRVDLGADRPDTPAGRTPV